MRTDLLLLGKFFNISSLAFFDVKCLHIKQWGRIIIDNKWNAISSQANNLSIFPNQNTTSQGTGGGKRPSTSYYEHHSVTDCCTPSPRKGSRN